MTMRKLMGLAPLLFLSAGLAGCASTEPYGNFLGANAPATVNESLAADTVQQLVTLYPPAGSHPHGEDAAARRSGEGQDHGADGCPA